MTTSVSRLWLLAAFAAVYIVWGSTYIGILFAIESIPGFLMAGTRFLVAGLIMYLLARAPAIKPGWHRSGAIVGLLLCMGGNGAVVWAEQYVPTGTAALLIALTPIFMVLMDWRLFGGAHPSGQTALGLLVGLVGLAVLVGGPGAALHPLATIGMVVVVCGSMSWSLGSMVARHQEDAPPPLVGAALQMFYGGLGLLGLGLVTGEAAHFKVADITMRSALAWLYLVLFGSVLAYSAYSWLLRVVRPALLATYAYVNPVVAVLLGWMLNGERLTPPVMLGAAVIVAGVVLVTTAPKAGEARAVEEPRPPASGRLVEAR